MDLFLQKIIEKGISPNQYYLLYCLHKHIIPEHINPHLEARVLRSLKFLTPENGLTELSLALIKDIESLTKLKPLKSDIRISTDYIDQYLDLWPKIKLPSGKYARSDRKNLETSFKWFFANYKYSWDTILKATAMYLDEYELKNYMYMRTSQYFIKKAESDKSINSELANYCALIESGQTDAGEVHFKDNVV